MIPTISLPIELKEKLAAYPSCLSNLADVFHKGQLPADYVPEVVQIMFDEFPVYHWDKGKELLNVEMRLDFVPRLVEWAFDGELVYVVLNRRMILNRIQYIATLSELRRNYASKS